MPLILIRNVYSASTQIISFSETEDRNMIHREQVTYLSTGGECYVSYFRVSELMEEQIQPKPPRDVHASAGGARVWTIYLLEPSGKVIGQSSC